MWGICFPQGTGCSASAVGSVLRVAGRQLPVHSFALLLKPYGAKILHPIKPSVPSSIRETLERGGRETKLISAAGVEEKKAQLHHLFRV